MKTPRVLELVGNVPVSVYVDTQTRKVSRVVVWDEGIKVSELTLDGYDATVQAIVRDIADSDDEWPAWEFGV